MFSPVTCLMILLKFCSMLIVAILVLTVNCATHENQANTNQKLGTKKEIPENDEGVVKSTKKGNIVKASRITLKSTENRDINEYNGSVLKLTENTTIVENCGSVLEGNAKWDIDESGRGVLKCSEDESILKIIEKVEISECVLKCTKRRDIGGVLKCTKRRDIGGNGGGVLTFTKEKDIGDNGGGVLKCTEKSESLAVPPKLVEDDFPNMRCGHLNFEKTSREISVKTFYGKRKLNSTTLEFKKQPKVVKYDLGKPIQTVTIQKNHTDFGMKQNKDLYDADCLTIKQSSNINFNDAENYEIHDLVEHSFLLCSCRNCDSKCFNLNNDVKPQKKRKKHIKISKKRRSSKYWKDLFKDKYKNN